MIPFNVKVGGEKVGITWESLFWFFIVTAAATAFGTYAWTVLQPYVPGLPAPPTTGSKTT